jgi:adenosylmethionine-8-amino-7-oxononanoate aminotransferase
MLDLAVTKIRKKGILLDPEGNSCILFYPPLISTEEQLGQAIEIIHTALVETYVQTNCGAKTL